MIEAVAYRFVTSDEGTFSSLIVPDRFACVLGELPWRGNAVNVSCIPEGVYRCTKEFLKGFREPHFGYRVHDVPGRTGILIHRGNHCGDERWGFKTDVQGCLLPGLRVERLDARFDDGRPSILQQAVTSSKTALERLVLACGEEFMLRIESRTAQRFLVADAPQ
jgi:hypothetical protein